MTLRLNQAGFSLVEMLVMVAVGGIVMFGLISMNVSSMKATKTIDTNGKINDIFSLLRIQLASETACTAKLLPNLGPDLNINLGAVSSVSKTVNKITDTATEAALEVGKPIRGIGGSNVESITLNNFEQLGPTSDGGIGFQAKIFFQLNRGSSGIGSQMVATQAMPVFFKTNSAGTIQSCSVSNSTLSNADIEALQYNACIGIGAKWTGSSCSLSDHDNQLMGNMCTAMGGDWNGSNCSNIRNVAAVQAPAPAPAPAPSVCPGGATSTITMGSVPISGYPPSLFPEINCGHMYNAQNEQGQPIICTLGNPMLNSATAVINCHPVSAFGPMVNCDVVCNNGQLNIQSCSCTY